MVQQLAPSGIENNITNLFDTFSIKTDKTQGKTSWTSKSADIIPPQLVFYPAEPLREIENVVVHGIVKNVAFFYNYIFPFPNKIKYDPKARKFFIQKSSILSKVVCVIWMALIIWRLSLRILPGSETSKGLMAAVVKASYVIFVVYNLVFFVSLWTRGGKIVSIFNQIVDLSSDLCFKLDSVPNTKLVLYTTHASWIFSFGFAFITHVLHKIVSLWYTKECATVGCCASQNCTNTDSYDLNKVDPAYSSIMYQGLIMLANFLNTGNWMMSFLYIGTWAFAFRQLLSIFYSRIKTTSEKSYEVNLVKEIRTFNKIGTILDNFNKIHGGHIVFGSLTAVFYVVSSIEQVITNIKNIAQYSQVFLTVSYFPIVAATLMVSDLHRMASIFADIVKKQYSKWTCPSSEKAAEALFGISIVYHDLSTANIGFKGLSFFTVTYPFVATMLSLVITYSIVVIQWFPQLNQKQ